MESLIGTVLDVKSEVDKLQDRWDISDDRLYAVENKVSSWEREIDNFRELGSRDRLVQEVVESLSRGFWGEFRKDLKEELHIELKREIRGFVEDEEAFANSKRIMIDNKKIIRDN